MFVLLGSSMLLQSDGSVLELVFILRCGGGGSSHLATDPSSDASAVDRFMLPTVYRQPVRLQGRNLSRECGIFLLPIFDPRGLSKGKGIKEEDGRLRLERINTLLVYLTNHHLSDWPTKDQYMAGSVVSFIAEKLGNLLVEEVILLQGVHDEVEWMERQMRWMQAFLKDADTKRRGDGIAYWVNQVREFVFDAEDIVDTYILKIHQHQLHGFIRRCTCTCHKLPVRHNIGIEVQRIKSRLREIYDHRELYGINYTNIGGIQEQMSLVDKTVKERRELAIQKHMNVVVGFDDDTMKPIMEVLFDEEKKRRCVISLVGMGGLGKSTLAKRICDENSVKVEFHDRCALVSVSQTYTLSKVLKDIAKELPNFREKLDKTEDEETEIRKKLSQFLEQGKYLIVLDDVWGSEAWNLIQPFLPDVQNGSRVIITTRSMEVATSADPSTPPHQLKTLDEDKSWDLFTKIVFVDEEVEKGCTGNLKKLGKEIVKNCGGLPLALVVMGGLLSTKERSVRAWQTVKDGFDWVESPEGEVPLKTLALSYEALPQHLKSCFLYFSAFPEDFVISAKKLIRLWIAEGFVPDETRKQQRRMGRTMEGIAEGWLEDLIQRCLIQVVERSPSGRVQKCRVHDLVLDLAIKEGEEVNFFHSCKRNMVGRISPPSMARRLALHAPCTDQKGYTSLEFSTPNPLRTFLGINSEVSSLQFVKRLQLLRVLDLDGADCTKLPSAIGDIIHLRYLGLKRNSLRSIPTSIRKLRNLQTLDVRENRYLKGLRKSVWGIRALRHVLIDVEMKFQIAGKVDLVNLQTLKYAAAGSWIRKSLATMRNLLVLAIFDILPTHHHALAESLDSLLHLQRLHLGAKEGVDNDNLLPRKALALPNHHHLEELYLDGRLLLGDPLLQGYPKSVANDALPSYSIRDLPPNLCTLRLYKCRLQQDPLALLEKLPHLKSLELTNDAYVGEEAVCSAGGFPQLASLKLKELEHIKRLRVEGAEAMPCLNHMVIYRCGRLKDLPPRLKNLRTLDIADDLRRQCFPHKLKRRRRRPVPRLVRLRLMVSVIKLIIATIT